MDRRTLFGQLDADRCRLVGLRWFTVTGNAVRIAKLKYVLPSDISAVKAELGFLPVEKTPLATRLSRRTSLLPHSPHLQQHQLRAASAPVLFSICTGASYKFYSLPWREMPFRVDHSLVYFYGSIFLSWVFILGLQPLVICSPNDSAQQEEESSVSGGWERGDVSVCKMCRGVCKICSGVCVRVHVSAGMRARVCLWGFMRLSVRMF